MDVMTSIQLAIIQAFILNLIFQQNSNGRHLVKFDLNHTQLGT